MDNVSVTKSPVFDRLAALRAEMTEAGIDAYIVPTSDYHNSEYVDDFFKCREFLSGFTGSNGTLVITAKEAGLWTDGRYFLQADNELAGTEIILFKMGEPGVPKILEYLKANLSSGQTVGFDGRTIPANEGIRYEKELSALGISISYELDLVDKIWNDRPSLPNHPIYVLPIEISGKEYKSKLTEVREEILKSKAKGWLCTKLDDIMWLLNIRGCDVECNPVALSYLYVNDSQTHLFIQSGELEGTSVHYLKENDIVIHEYNEVYSFIKQNCDDSVLIDYNNISFLFYKNVSNNSKVINKTNPTEFMKAIKNECELTNSREVYLRDSVALTRFIYWLKTNVGKIPMDEMSVAEKLDDFRRKLPGFIDLSFPTISAYADNAAIVHYEATEKTNKEITNKGMYLVDSGGQYMGGTTDVTRTIVLGEVNAQMKEHFTLVAVGMLRLAAAKFMDGCTGRNLDIIARQPMWDRGLDYKHGTGHGVGFILNVHEGPQNIRWRYLEKTSEAVLKPGMITSDEPGLYIEGSHGIRTENIVEVTDWMENSDGKCYQFKHLTYVPIDLEGIDLSVMEQKDIDLLNEYHSQVREKILDYMETEEEKEWLVNATRSI